MVQYNMKQLEVMSHMKFKRRLDGPTMACSILRFMLSFLGPVYRIRAPGKLSQCASYALEHLMLHAKCRRACTSMGVICTHTRMSHHVYFHILPPRSGPQTIITIVMITTTLAHRNLSPDGQTPCAQILSSADLDDML